MSERARGSRRPPPARRAGRRAAIARRATALLGVSLLGVALAGAVSNARASARDDLDRALLVQARMTAQALGDHFERTRSIDLLLANDAAVRALDPAAGGGPPGGPLSEEASAALAYLEELFPGRISEACVINLDGHELARVVEGTVAPAHELSTDEAHTTFFAPTLALRPGEVHQAAPYVSADTAQWVISSSTPIAGADGATWGMLHFEMSLASFRPRATEDRGISVLLVDRSTGRLLLESDREHVDGQALGRRGSPELTELLQGTADLVGVTVGDRRVSLASVPQEPGNANDWVVVAAAPPGAVPWNGVLAVVPLSLGASAALLLLVSALNFRARARSAARAARTDELTGLPNRRHLNERLDEDVARAVAGAGGCALLLLDLDRFKEVNDRYGHPFGDALLQCVADRLAVAFRTGDLVARLGGDEFAVLLRDVEDGAAARLRAEVCHSVLAQPVVVDGVGVTVSASVGVALAPGDAVDRAGLVAAADAAMYQAKAGGVGVVLHEGAAGVSGL